MFALALLVVLGTLLLITGLVLRGLVRWIRRNSSHSLTLSPMIKRIVALAFIFGCCSLAWLFLGATVVERTQSSESSTRADVGALWGGPQVQYAPQLVRLDEVTRTVTRQEPTGAPDGSFRSVDRVVTQATREPVALAGSDLATDIQLDHRKRGLMWYATYGADFQGTYRVENDGEAGDFEFVFPLPTQSSLFSDLALQVDGRAVEVDVDGGEIRHTLALDAGETTTVEIRYGSQGVGTWTYDFGGAREVAERASEYGSEPPPPARPTGGVRTARDVKLVISTDFTDIDFPAGTLSPTEKKRTDDGWALTWDPGTLVASAGFGIEMPQRLNPGPWVSRVTFFAPVSLFLFFFAVFVLSILRGVRLHPMHYFFLGAACFAFHLLLAYLVDVVPIGVAMTVASVVSVGLVVSYVRLVAGARFALVEVGGAQMVYLVAFAATFFLEGMTGLAVTLLSVATLFVVMQATGRLDWEAVLSKPDADIDAARRDQPAVAV